MTDLTASSGPRGIADDPAEGRAGGTAAEGAPMPSAAGEGAFLANAAAEDDDRPAGPAPEADPTSEAPGLDEMTLEALLFVAERPLSRREVAALAGVSRDEVDARL